MVSVVVFPSPAVVGLNCTAIVQLSPAPSEGPHVPPVPGYEPPAYEKLESPAKVDVRLVAVFAALMFFTGTRAEVVVDPRPCGPK
jgi:hypothetical protein